MRRFSSVPQFIEIPTQPTSSTSTTCSTSTTATMSDIPTASSPKESVPSFRRASLRRTCHSSRCTAAETNASMRVFSTQSSPFFQNKKHTATTDAPRTIDTTTDRESETHSELLERFLSLQTTKASSSSNATTGRRLPPAPPRDQINSRSSLRLSARVPAVLLERLSTFLRVHSIEHTFHFSNDDDEEEEKSVRVCCRTANLLRFVVLLWRGGNDDDDDDDDNSMVVEVQRRKGCSVEMQCVRRALFAALQQASDDEATTTTCSSSSQQHLSMCHKMIPSSFCKKVYEKYRPSTEQQSSSTTQLTTSSSSSSSSSIASDESSVECCLERCSDLLNSACTERNQLGLECLVDMTDPAIADRKTAKEGAWSTLQDKSFIQQLLLRYITQKESADEKSETNEEELHTLALMVLVNSLRVFRADDDLLEQHRPQMMDASSDFWRSILESCQTDLATVAQHPRDAELSIEVLHSVLELVPRAVAAAIVRDCRRRMLIEHLMEANSFGKLYLLSLEEKSQGLLDHLQMYL